VPAQQGAAENIFPRIAGFKIGDSYSKTSIRRLASRLLATDLAGSPCYHRFIKCSLLDKEVYVSYQK
jgi:hypothetical protein